MKKKVISNAAKVNEVAKVQTVDLNSAQLSKKEAVYTCINTSTVEWARFWAAMSSVLPHYKSIMNSKKRTAVYKALTGKKLSVVLEKLNDAIKAGVLYRGSPSADLRKYLEAK